MPELTLDAQDGTEPLVLTWERGFAVQQPGPLGLGLPPRKVVERQRADGRGSDLVATILGARDITIPIDVYGRNHSEFRARRRRLQQIVGRSTHDRPVRVTYVDDDGVAEWIEGVYVGGMEGDAREATSTSELFAVVLRDGCPYWRLATVTEGWGLEPPPVRGWFPLLGNYPQASSPGGRRTLVVPGDAAVYPPWVIQGPGAGLTISNITASWTVTIDHDIPASGPSSLVTVTTEFGEQAVRDAAGTNLFGTITNGPEGGWVMGPLLPGENIIEVRLDTPGENASVSIAYEPLALAA